MSEGPGKVTQPKNQPTAPQIGNQGRLHRQNDNQPPRGELAVQGVPFYINASGVAALSLTLYIIAGDIYYGTTCNKPELTHDAMQETVIALFLIGLLIFGNRH